MIKVVELGFRAHNGKVNVDTRVDVGTETQPEWICLNHESIPVESPVYWSNSEFYKQCGEF